MEKLELRARARAAARAAGLFDLPARARNDGRPESRGRTSTGRRPRPAATALGAVDEAQARAACAPMGELEYVIEAADATGRMRTMYVIVPDFAMKAQYERLGFTLEEGCRVLLDAAALVPLAVLKLAHTASVREPCPSASGFNPYFDLPGA